MIPIFVIFFREGLEASLVISMILTYLRRLGHRTQSRMVWWSIAAALVLDLGVGLGFFHWIGTLQGAHLQTVWEGTTYLAAAAMLTGMSFWMKSQSHHMATILKRQVTAATDARAQRALGGLAFVTVGWEGLETGVFSLAIVGFHHGAGFLPGALAGTAVALVVDVMVMHFGYRVPLNGFFNGLGGLLLVFSAALLANGIEAYQSLGWIPWMRQVLRHSEGWLAQSSLGGSLLHVFVGYATEPTYLQMAAYALFLAVGGGAYFFPRRPKNRPCISDEGNTTAGTGMP